MRVEITRLTRRGAAVMRRPEIVTAESVRFGRGTGNEVALTDLRVELLAASLSQRADGMFFEQRGALPLRVNGQSTGGALVHPDDEILIGPYKITIAEPPEGFDAALTVELTQPMGDALQRLMTQSRLRLEDTGLSKRRASWGLFFVFVVVCLAAPIVAYTSGHVVSRPTEVPRLGLLALVAMTWNPGELSNQHRSFASNCITCHQSAFTAVKDAACLTCHRAIGNHIGFTATRDLEPIQRRLQQTRCAQCHEEHRGLDSLVIREGALCIDCHHSLAEAAPNAGIRDVRGFPVGHPQFRITLVRDPAQPSFERVDLGSSPKPADHPNLVFSHAAHLVPDGFPVLGYKPMVCRDCHVAEPSGQGFLAITYKGQCQSCHALKFDGGSTRSSLYLQQKPEVPHGNAARVEADVAGFYASLVLKGGVDELQAPDIVRRVPGSSFAPDEPQRREAQDWVAAKTKEALAIVFFDPKRGCAYCHVVKRNADTLKIEPVRLLTRFLLPARFDHARHASVDCAGCHDARHSSSSSDILIPGIENCTTCHGAETAAYKARTTCISCHVFHRQELGPMREIVAMEK